MTVRDDLAAAFSFTPHTFTSRPTERGLLWKQSADLAQLCREVRDVPNSDIATPHAITASTVESGVSMRASLSPAAGDQFAQCCSLVLVSFQSKQGMPDYPRFRCQTAADQKRLPKTTAMAVDSTAIALALHGEHTPEFRGHHTNTEATPKRTSGNRDFGATISGARHWFTVS
jgi:hypothetical protein